MTNFNKQDEGVKGFMDWGFYTLAYIQQTGRKMYEFLSSFPDLNSLLMSFSVKTLSRYLRCYSYVFHWKDTTIKLFTPFGGAIKKAELQCNQKALQAHFWSGNVIAVSTSPLSLAMIKGIPVSASSLKQVEQFVSEKLDEAMEHEQQPANFTYSHWKLQQLGQQGLNLSIVQECQTLLASLKLPITSAHGDLHIENLILVDQEIKIIDWSMYNCNGSFVTDYIHFYNFLEAMEKKESWTSAILREQDYLESLAQRLDTTPNHLKVVYTLNRIAGEASQFTSLNLLPDRQIDKYNSALTHLVSAIKQNV